MADKGLSRLLTFSAAIVMRLLQPAISSTCIAADSLALGHKQVTASIVTRMII
jgi:hypothetical protein